VRQNIQKLVHSPDRRPAIGAGSRLLEREVALHVADAADRRKESKHLLYGGFHQELMTRAHDPTVCIGNAYQVLRRLQRLGDGLLYIDVTTG
jgi:hypothetical protein